MDPIFDHRLAELLIIETGISKECGCDKNVAYEGADLCFKRLAPFLPSCPLGSQTVKKANASIHFKLNAGHLGLDGLGFTDQSSIFSLVGSNAALQGLDSVLDSLRFCLGLKGLLLKLID